MAWRYFEIIAALIALVALASPSNAVSLLFIPDLEKTIF